MKIFCYMILLLAFLMFYQSNPMYAMGVIVLAGVIFVYMKRKKKIRMNGGISRGGGALFSSPAGGFGGGSSSNDVLMFLLMGQGFMKDQDKSFITPHEISEKEKQIEITKNEILEMLK